MDSTWLTQEYERLCGDPSSDIWEHLPTLVRHAEEVNAKKIIELGVREGLSTIAFLKALEDKGHLWSVDCSFPMSADGQLSQVVNPQGPLGVVEYWTFILGYDNWDPVLKALPMKADIIFIDTQHTYEQTALELELYYPRVRKGGRMLLHDTDVEVTGNAVTPQPPYPVLTAVREFCEKNDLSWDNEPHCNGLGTIYC